MTHRASWVFDTSAYTKSPFNSLMPTEISFNDVIWRDRKYHGLLVSIESIQTLRRPEWGQRTAHVTTGTWISLVADKQTECFGSRKKCARFLQSAHAGVQKSWSCFDLESWNTSTARLHGSDNVLRGLILAGSLGEGCVDDIRQISIFQIDSSWLDILEQMWPITFGLVLTWRCFTNDQCNLGHHAVKSVGNILWAVRRIPLHVLRRLRAPRNSETKSACNSLHAKTMLQSHNPQLKSLTVCVCFFRSCGNYTSHVNEHHRKNQARAANYGRCGFHFQRRSNSAAAMNSRGLRRTCDILPDCAWNAQDSIEAICAFALKDKQTFITAGYLHTVLGIQQFSQPDDMP